MTIWILPAAAALVSYGLCRVLAHPRLGLRVLDRPGARSLHDRPTPRTGGIAILAALVATAGTARATPLPIWLDAWVMAGAALLAVVSFVDDVRSLGPALRLPMHVAAVALLLAGGYGLSAVHVPGDGLLSLGPVGQVIALLFGIWMCNLYNFMDGMDGFAGGMGGIGFAALGTLGLQAGRADFALAAFLVAGANLGFLGVNFPPARIFMGDVGSVPMGFLAAAFSLAGVRMGVSALWVPVLVFSPFIVDATVTLIRRLLRGERVWQAHRSHYYQRLVLLGWGHRKTVIAGYAIMLSTAATAIAFGQGASRGWELAAVLGWALAYLVIALLIHHLERRRRVNAS
ncbi:MAG TPA: glycosyltransferase family 4 protein [bacterium]|nr:glycosyltransferase family 4 protein [bacterium]